MKIRTLLIIGIVTLLACVTQARQDELARSIRDARAEAIRSDAQLKETLESINALATQRKGDLRPAYDTYGSAVTQTQAAAEWTRNRIAWMAGDGRRSFKDWQATVDGISNDSLRKKARRRLHTVQVDYDKMEKALSSEAK